MDESTEWYFQAQRKYVWNLKDISDYVEVFMDVTYTLIEEQYGVSEYLQDLASPDIGMLKFHDEDGQDWGYGLYIANVKPRNYSGYRTLFANFKVLYQIHVGAGDTANFLGNVISIRSRYPAEKAEKIISRLKLARNFTAIANKSLNHRRHMPARIRYQVLQRDKSTCQICGRRPPTVSLHVDHIKPVSHNFWHTEDNLDNYQVLCEDCNLGKGDLF